MRFFPTFFKRFSAAHCNVALNIFELRYFLDDRGLSTSRRLCGPSECLGLRELLSPNLCPYFPVAIRREATAVHLDPQSKDHSSYKEVFFSFGETLMGKHLPTICQPGGGAFFIRTGNYLQLGSSSVTIQRSSAAQHGGGINLESGKFNLSGGGVKSRKCQVKCLLNIMHTRIL